MASIKEKKMMIGWMKMQVKRATQDIRQIVT
jgi:hypothetical protein